MYICRRIAIVCSKFTDWCCSSECIDTRILLPQNLPKPTVNENLGTITILIDHHYAAFT